MKTWYTYVVKIHQKDVAFYESGEMQVPNETPSTTLKKLMLAKYPKAERCEIIILDELNGAIR